MHVPQPRRSCDFWFGLVRFRSPLLTESLICFLFLRVLRWFNSPGSLVLAYEFSQPFQDRSWRVAPFGHPRIKAYEAAPRGFSQPITSFVASRCLGIHRLPLLCFVPSSHSREVEFIMTQLNLLVQILAAHAARIYKDDFNSMKLSKNSEKVVDARRIELLTPRMQIWCSPS